MAGIETQISGKYNPENTPLFAFKGKLEGAGITVRYPRGKAVTNFSQGFAMTNHEEEALPFQTTELGVLRSIRETPVSVVYNRYKDAKGEFHEGYIGESASVEILYAIARNKPVILVRPPQLGDTVPIEVRKIIEQHKNKLIVQNLETFTPDELQEFLSRQARIAIDYELTEDERRKAMQSIFTLTHKLRVSWGMHMQETLHPL